MTALAPVMVAQGKGYFAAEGLDAELVPFDAPVPVAQAVVSGAVDFGTTGPSGAFYNLAGQGALRIIAGMAREAPSFQFLAVLASNRAYTAGLTSVKALAGHSVAVSDIGGAAHYSLTLIEEKYHIDPASVRVTPLQGISAAISALAGGSVDASSSPVHGLRAGDRARRRQAARLCRRRDAVAGGHRLHDDARPRTSGATRSRRCCAR